MALRQDSEVAVPPPVSPDSCAVCGESQKLMRCAKCMSVAYCSREHQKQDWKKHKKTCKDKVTSKEPTAAVVNTDKVRKQPDGQAKAPGEGDANPGTQNKTIDLSFQFDERPYKPIQFPQPTAKDPATLAAHVTTRLKQDNYCVVNNFLNPKLALAIRSEVTKLHSSGIFVDGQLSGGRTSSEASQIVTKKTIRGDKITWLQGNEKENFPYICLHVKTLDGLLSRINSCLDGEYEIGGRTKAMVACYPGNGTGYACHVDNPNKDGRCITCLYYLNEGWDARSDGGLLRLFPASGDHVDVEPFLNRMLFFWSDRRNPHEVQPAFKTRYAITVWYFDKQERQEAKEAMESRTNGDINKLQQQYALMDLKSKEAEKVAIKDRIKEQAQSALNSLTEEELQSVLAMIEQHPNPREVLTSLKIAPAIQEALLALLQDKRQTDSSPTT
ncbi:egl nine homolog 1-like [Diadema setosum]|uniref:egl nine homolog 1-like n=1 Tax=Diadema setosum TaxID=31175 RepID=UPI003B3B7880